jgi:hypothetical protein
MCIIADAGRFSLSDFHLRRYKKEKGKKKMRRTVKNMLFLSKSNLRLRHSTLPLNCLRVKKEKTGILKRALGREKLRTKNILRLHQDGRNVVRSACVQCGPDQLFGLGSDIRGSVQDGSKLIVPDHIVKSIGGQYHTVMSHNLQGAGFRLRVTAPYVLVHDASGVMDLGLLGGDMLFGNKKTSQGLILGDLAQDAVPEKVQSAVADMHPMSRTAAYQDGQQRSAEAFVGAGILFTVMDHTIEPAGDPHKLRYLPVLRDGIDAGKLLPHNFGGARQGFIAQSIGHIHHATVAFQTFDQEAVLIGLPAQSQVADPMETAMAQGKRSDI